MGEFLEKFKNAKPNPGHKAIADMEGMGYIKSIITQNGDNLHTDAGNTEVYELHGNIFRFRCLQCSKKRVLERDDLFEIMESMIEKFKGSIEEIFEFLPQCNCSGIMRPDVVAFGEQVQCLREATRATFSCDLMLIVGTSGVVYPAASLPMRAREIGACLIEVNPKESELTPICDLFIPGAAGEVLPKLVSALKMSKH